MQIRQLHFSKEKTNPIAIRGLNTMYSSKPINTLHARSLKSGITNLKRNCFLENQRVVFFFNRVPNCIQFYYLISGDGLSKEASRFTHFGEWEASRPSKPKPEDSVSCETEKRECQTY